MRMCVCLLEQERVGKMHSRMHDARSSERYVLMGQSWQEAGFVSPGTSPVCACWEGGGCVLAVIRASRRERR